MNNYLIAILSGIVLVLAALYFYAKESPPALEADNFVHDGVVIKDNPGFKAGIWYLSYEEPGRPALSVELDLRLVPDSNLSQGERVHVVGNLRGAVVLVRSTSSVSAETGTSIKLYYYNPALDQGAGGTQCTEKGLVAVSRMIPKTTTPLTESIKLLLRGELSEEERTQGITTEFPLEGVALTSATIENGIATVTFNDPQNKTSGGSCRVHVLSQQIQATAKQFPSVKSVRFMPEEMFQP